MVNINFKARIRILAAKTFNSCVPQSHPPFLLAVTENTGKQLMMHWFFSHISDKWAIQGWFTTWCRINDQRFPAPPAIDCRDCKHVYNIHCRWLELENMCIYNQPVQSRHLPQRWPGWGRPGQEPAPCTPVENAKSDVRKKILSC